MKKIIIKRTLIILAVIIASVLLGIFLRQSIYKIIVAAAVVGGFTTISTGEQKIKKNKQKIKDMEKAKNDQEKEINNTDYDNYDLANDPVNQLLHKRLELRRDQGNN